MPLETFQGTLYLPGSLTALCPGIPSHRATFYLPLQLTQIWPFFLCSYSPPRTSTQHMGSDLLFIRHITFELLSRSMHWARSMRTRKERELPQGVLIMDKVNSYQSGVTVVTKKKNNWEAIKSISGWAGGLLESLWCGGQEPEPP